MVRDDEFEECIVMLATTFQSGVYYMLAPLYTYVRWCMQADRRKSYEEYVQFFKNLPVPNPRRRLVLKAPAHTGSMADIKRLMPDAMLIQTHRHPVDVCNSVNSLAYSAHCNVVKRLDIRKTADCNLDFSPRNLTETCYQKVSRHQPP